MVVVKSISSRPLIPNLCTLYALQFLVRASVVAFGRMSKEPARLDTTTRLPMISHNPRLAASPTLVLTKTYLFLAASKLASLKCGMCGSLLGRIMLPGSISSQYISQMGNSSSEVGSAAPRANPMRTYAAHKHFLGG
jgi:hypothetical protein